LGRIDLIEMRRSVLRPHKEMLAGRLVDEQ
jgi:hypothetical protein